MQHRKAPRGPRHEASGRALHCSRRRYDGLPDLAYPFHDRDILVRLHSVVSGVLIGDWFVEREDFVENPPKKFFRLSPGREVRLRYAYFITCREVVKDAAGEVTELRCIYDPATRGGNAPPDGRKVKATLHWVAAANAVTAEVRVLNQLFLSAAPNMADFLADLNPDSLQVLTNAMVEPAAVQAGGEEPMQFERQGYFRQDGSSSSGAPIRGAARYFRQDARRRKLETA